MSKHPADARVDPFASPQVCADPDCRNTKARVMIRMRPGPYSPAGVDPRSVWWLCGACWLAGVRPNKLGNVVATQ